MLEDLKKQICAANLLLREHRLVTFTWGNVSGFDPDSGLFVIKPSGVSYDDMKPEDMVVLNLQCRIVEGSLRPSSDSPTHAVLYQKFPEIRGVAHTHSRWATIWAQAGLGIPAYGTTHADSFYGEVPCTRQMTDEEIAEDYEENTGHVIVQCHPDPMRIPAVLVASHGPFCWGRDAAESVHNSVVLEEAAMMAWHTRQIRPGAPPIRQQLLDRHYLRKHGSGAYYGQ